jgi:hypothetical protein
MYQTKAKQVNVLVIGEEGSGRRSLAARFGQSLYRDNEFKATGAGYTVTKHFTLAPDDKDISLTLDVPHRSRSISLSQRLADIDIVLITMDLSKQGCIATLNSYIKQVKQQAVTPKILCVGTKAETDVRRVSSAVLKNMVTEYPLVELSAKTGEGFESLNANLGVMITQSIAEEQKASCVIL